jgi:hypothetical protein
MEPGTKNQDAKYVIQVVPHGNQRYETIGDWIPGEPVQICVSRMKDERHVFLVAIHELIEYELCRMRGIGDAEVVSFDSMFELERSVGLHSAASEPGDDPRAPYRKEHAFATMIERLVAQKLGVRWSDYQGATVEKESRRKDLIRAPARPRARTVQGGRFKRSPGGARKAIRPDLRPRDCLGFPRVNRFRAGRTGPTRPRLPGRVRPEAVKAFIR